MSKIVYKIVEHDGGWAYTAEGSYSETFSSYDEALSAARKVAREQVRPDEDTTISFEDANGRWHEEKSDGHNRPEPMVDK